MQIDDTLQQIKDIMTNTQVSRVLVTSGKNVDPDAVGSALALAEALESMDKTVTVAIEDFDADKMSFLPGVSRIENVVGQKSLVVSIDVGENPIKKINYNSEDTKFNLILTPKSGQVDVDQINYSYAGLNYDAIFVVDTADKKLMGDWINSFEQEMQNIPLINIDHHADNTRFGTLNLVDDQAAAASMVVHELLMSLQLPLSQNQATNLLAGVLSDTNGFVNRNADANSLNSASQLTANGADLHGLTQALFKSLSLPALHLWGIVLSRAQIEEPGIVITHLTQKDIQQTNARKADEESLGVIVNMYIPAVVGAKVGVVLKEDEEGNIKGSLRSIDPRVNVQAIAKQLNGGGHILASGFKLDNQSMDQARQKVLHSIRQELDKNTSLSEEKGSKASD